MQKFKYMAETNIVPILTRFWREFLTYKPSGNVARQYVTRRFDLNYSSRKTNSKLEGTSLFCNYYVFKHTVSYRLWTEYNR